MFNYLKGFYQRHKKKIITTGVLAVGTYAISKYVQWKYEEWEKEKVKEFTSFTKKQYHFESNQRTCTMTFFSFLPEMRNTIAEHLDTETLLEALRSKPSNKLEIWEQLKILSITRVICSVICSVTLLVILKVQLNVVGGYIFVQTSKKDESTLSSEMSETQLNYMNNVRHFVLQCIPNLIQDCLKLVQAKFQDLSLKEKLSHQRLRELLDEVMSELKGDATKEKHHLSKYTIDENFPKNEQTDEMYKKMTTETISLFESKDCSMVLNQCLDSSFDYVMDSLSDHFLGNEDPEAVVSLENCVKFSFYKQIELPIAKIIPLLNRQLDEIFRADSNGMLDVLFSQPHLRDFSSNIYEAFSKKYD